jgi:hypothetical protein
MILEMPLVYQVLDEWVRESGLDEEAKRFEARWRKLRPGKDALPCPQCFLEGMDQLLAPLDLEEGVFGAIRPWVCAHCKERFEVLLPT